MLIIKVRRKGGKAAACTRAEPWRPQPGVRKRRRRGGRRAPRRGRSGIAGSPRAGVQRRPPPVRQSTKRGVRAGACCPRHAGAHGYGVGPPGAGRASARQPPLPAHQPSLQDLPAREAPEGRLAPTGRQVPQEADLHVQFPGEATWIQGSCVPHLSVSRDFPSLVTDRATTAERVFRTPGLQHALHAFRRALNARARSSARYAEVLSKVGVGATEAPHCRSYLVSNRSRHPSL